MPKEDSRLIMIRHLFEIMKDSVENCDHKRVLQATANLTVNTDRAIISSGESNNLELQRKLMDIDKETSKLKGLFAAKCKCSNKWKGLIIK